MNRVMVVLLSFGLVVAVGCSDSDTTAPKADTGTTPAADTGGAAADTGGATPDKGASTAPTWTSVYTDVIAKTCGPCHTSGSSGGLSMKDKATAYTNLVGKAAAGGACSGKTRVVANKSGDSVLFNKVDRNANICGSPMPRGGAKLAAGDIKKIKDWIDGGAKND